MPLPNDAHERLASQNVENNIKAIESLRIQEDKQASRHQRLIERTTGLLGRPRTIYILLTLTVGWMLWNEIAPRYGWRCLDAPPFFWLQGLVSLVALLLTTMVLTTQQRALRQQEQRSHLDLQINLLAEQKIAKLIELVEELRRDLPIIDREDLVAKAMTQAVDPGNIVSVLEELKK